MGLDPISKVSVTRISYELGKIDFDIDSFPAIPSFLEIDIEYIEEEGFTVQSLLKKLGLENNRLVRKLEFGNKVAVISVINIVIYTNFDSLFKPISTTFFNFRTTLIKWL